MAEVKNGTSVGEPDPLLDRKGEFSDEKSKAPIGIGSPGRIRTSDQPVNSRLLYH